MAAPGRNSVLPTLARHLVKDGPVKTLRTPCRIRAFSNGACIADTLGTTGALYVWEHPYYPQYYVPREALIEKPKGYKVDYEERETIKNDENQQIATMLDVQVRRLQKVGKGAADEHFGNLREIKNKLMVFDNNLSGKAEELRGMVKIQFDAADQWFEEDSPIFIHPKDPFKRVDIVSSTRGIKISIEGHTVAETTTSMHLYETSLPVRYYIPLTSVDTSVLRPSQTRTRCPYKGEAEYYDVCIGDKVFKDIVWFYTNPTLESAAIAGLCCFYNEKVEVSIQVGDKWESERPERTIFS